MKQEDGFSIATLIVFVMALSVGMAAVAPNYQIEAQRELEEELIFRGEEYVRAIQKYQRRLGVYPPTIAALLDTNGIRFLRRAYVDPISGEEFRLLTATPTGGIEGSILYPANSIPLFQGNPQNSGSPSALQTGGGIRPDSNREGQREFGERSGRGFESSFEEGDRAQGPDFASPGSPDFEGGFGGSSSAGGGLGSGLSGSGFGLESGFGQESGGGRGLAPARQSGSGAPGGNQERGAGPGGFAAGSETAPAGSLSGIVGVAPTNSAPSLKVYNGREIYMEWEFIALPRGLGESVGGVGASGNLGNSSPPPTDDQNQNSPFVGSTPSPFQSQP